MHRKLLGLAGAVALAGILILSVAAGVAISLPTAAQPLGAIVPAATTAPVDPNDPDEPETPETPEQTSSPTPIDTGGVTPTPTRPATPDPTTTPASTPTDSATPTPGPEPTASPTPTAPSTVVPAVPPAIAASTISLPSLLIAIGVVVAGGVVVGLLMRIRPRNSPAAASTETPEEVAAPVVLDSMAALGTAMVDSGYPVGLVRDALEDFAAASGRPTIQAIVLPTSILVSSADSDIAQTRAVSAGDATHLLHQVDLVDRIVGVARTRPGAAAWVRRQIDRVATVPSPFSRAQRIIAYGLLSAALGVLLGASWPGVLLAGLLGIGVGAVLLSTAHLPSSFQALIVVGVSLCVALSVLIVAHLFDPGALPAIVAPLVILLPGGLLTVAVIELATGHFMSGAARAAAGGMRLLLLATGIVAASALLGIPALNSDESTPLGSVAPWIAVGVFGLGITVYQCARPASIGWITVVLYVAYGAQVLGDVLFDGVLSALIGAAVMTPVAVVISRQRTGPPALVSFLPAFWLLVPGALGLIGVASVLDGDLYGTRTIVTTIATMVAIALGVLIGLAVTQSLHGVKNSEFDRLDLFADVEEPESSTADDEKTAVIPGSDDMPPAPK